ncbi:MULTISPECIES: TetR/AcrR family transcriptional regulator [unclassified Sedimentibacter]|uniref:TetR/AcrR family transcriptional regulator n=1 Tax=unclassified Sedimentibacter TaxID=2649220 RepID=UPI0027DEDF0A|nr:TetR/AcrR family transcriptional regulator [Sedimentibacter sp. MB35-C1]WMJ77333.1 TetR/AcrR family transcriptional regulator [Sedimentibacter sp. MB35-C1]
MAGKNQKRSRILSAARVLFREKGYHDTKMDDIAQSAGVGKGTLYEYFKSKQDIFDETCVDFVKTLRDNIEEISLMDRSFKEKAMLLFKRGCDSGNEDFEKSPHDYIMSYKNLISEKVLKTMFDYVSEINRIIIEMIDQGKNEGVVNKEVPSYLISCLVLGTMKEYFNLKITKEDNIFKEGDIIFDLLFNGIGVK